MKCAVLTISDMGFAKLRRDESGPAVKARLEEEEATVPPVEILPDDRDMISARLREIADSGGVDVIFTTGGTGAALVVFGTSGTVQSVTVNSNVGLSPVETACVSSSFRRATVPAFSGSPVTVRKAFFVPGNQF